MKKLVLLVMMIALVFTLSACNNKEKLYVLNWGEYMNPDLIDQFEDEFDVEIVYETAGSNETMEVNILTGKTPYDIVFPSDYMIDKLNKQELLQEIDYTKLSNYEEGMFGSVYDLYKDKSYASYMIPYFYGTVGIMYNLDTVDEADLVDFNVLFDADNKYDIGLYDSPRDTVAAALLALGYSVNSNVEAELNAAETLLKNSKVATFGEDNLKVSVVEGNLDMALVYSGDYFDTLYSYEEDELDINFGFFVPETTNIWVDAFVIPTTSENTDLAYEFINFFLDQDVSLENADWVGYTPVIEEVYNIITDIDGDYGYDYDHYNPMPEGSSREMYNYISDARFERLSEILNNARN